MYKTDVCILGAGMAGLTLARQLKARRPELEITVVEHQRFPAAQATHKIGESTVEIAAHYLNKQLNMTHHLADAQLPKFGLRLFFRGERSITQDLSEYDELGASQTLPIDTYQLDRGRFENYLAQACVADGTQLRDGTTVRSIDLSPGCHQLRLRDAEQGTERQLQARYLVDASGRRAWLRKQQQLSRPARHDHQAIWFRVEGALELDDWGVGDGWRSRCQGSSRRYSTNHFTGPGYWLWLIPLSSNITSVGLVFDPKRLDPQLVRHHADLIRWLSQEHPIVAQHLEQRKPLDFRVLENYAVASKRVFSEEGWMLSGDAGIFADPLYSPGGDFIALANGYITELIASGTTDPATFAQCQRHYFAFFTNTLSLYRGQYAGFGHCDFMVIKTIWDFVFYWAVMSKLYFSSRYTDLDFMQAQQPILQHAAALNSGMQRHFRAFAKTAQRVGGESRFYDYWDLPWLHGLKQDLLDGDPADTGAQLRSNIQQLSKVSTSLQQQLHRIASGERLPGLDQFDGFA